MAKSFVTSMRLSDEGRRLLDALSHYYGISHTSVLEMVIRDNARKLALDAPPVQAESQERARRQAVGHA